MEPEDERESTNPDRRDMLKTMGVAAAEAPQAVPGEHNPPLEPGVCEPWILLTTTLRPARRRFP